MSHQDHEKNKRLRETIDSLSNGVLVDNIVEELMSTPSLNLPSRGVLRICVEKGLARTELAHTSPEPPRETNYQRLSVMLYRSLERLSLAIESLGKIGFAVHAEGKPWEHEQTWVDLNDAQKDAKLKLKHYSVFVAALEPAEPSTPSLREVLIAIHLKHDTSYRQASEKQWWWTCKCMAGEFAFGTWEECHKKTREHWANVILEALAARSEAPAAPPTYDEGWNDAIEKVAIFFNDEANANFMPNEPMKILFKALGDQIRGFALAPGQPAVAPTEQQFLRTLVDVVWGHCYENGSVPATEVADKLIAKARVWAAAPKEGK